MLLFTVIGVLVVVGLSGFMLYLTILAAWGWLSERFNWHQGTRWTIGSPVTERSFISRFWGVSFVLRNGGPTRGFFYSCSERDRDA